MIPSHSASQTPSPTAATPVAVPPAYYEHGGITIYHGDAREFLPLLTADCVITDPPYGLGELSGTTSKARNRNAYGGGEFEDTEGYVRDGHQLSRRTEVSKIPNPLSIGEETFALQCKAYGLTPIREYQFCDRKWRFDFAFISRNIAVEIEGGTSFGKSRHSFGGGFEGDAKKYNEATKLGWRVLRYSTAMVERGDAINDVLEMMP